MIDGRIKVTVVKVNGKSISLGIEAPSEVNICRGELDGRGIELPNCNQEDPACLN